MILDPDQDPFFKYGSGNNLSWIPDPDPGAEKAADPESGSATQINSYHLDLVVSSGCPPFSFMGIIVLLWNILMKKWRGLVVRTDGSDRSAGRQAGRSRT
jgi:hypothetical protein